MINKDEQRGKHNKCWDVRRITNLQCIDDKFFSTLQCCVPFSRGYMCNKKVKRVGTSLVEGAVNGFSF